jgi:hypothetical protein
MTKDEETTTAYCEANAKAGGIKYDIGHTLLDHLLQKVNA